MGRSLRAVTAKEEFRRRVDGLTEAQALEPLRALEGQAEGAGGRLDALLDSAPPEDEALLVRLPLAESAG